MLAADAQTQIGAGLAAIVGSHLDQLADADLIEVLERIALVDLVLVVCAEELGSIVTAEAEGHLGQVVGAEAEELSLLGDLTGGQSGARDLDHGTDLILHVNAGSSDQLVRDLDDNVLDELQLLDLADQRDHDVGGDHVAGLSRDVQGCLDDSAGLHRGDLRVGDSQTAATVTHHGVELVQGSNDVLQVIEGHAHIGSQLLDVLVLGGQELVQRRVQITDGHRALTHDAVHRLEVTLLERLDLGQSSLALFHGTGADHLTDSLDAVLREEHMLGTAQADALSTQIHCLLCIARVIRIGHDQQLTSCVSPAHEAVEVLVAGSGDGCDLLAVDVAGGAVDGDPIALDELVAVDLEGLSLFVDLDLVVVAAAGDAAGAHTTSNNGCVAGHAAADSQDALRNLHTDDVLRRGLQTDQNDLLHLAGLDLLLCFLSSEDDLAAGGTGRSC